MGEIALHSIAEGYLEAELIGPYEGLLELAAGGQLNSVGCGGSILGAFNIPVFISLK